MYRIWYPDEFEFASSHLNRDDRHRQHGVPDHQQPDDDAGDPVRRSSATAAALIRYLLVTAALGTAFMVMKGFEYAAGLPREVRPRHDVPEPSTARPRPN